MRFEPHNYQTKSIDFILWHKCCALFEDMGLGKTVSTLTALDRLINDYLEVRRVLVIAPKSVAQNTWSSEARKWDHLKDLRLSVVMGTAAQRRKALEADADIYVINRDNVVWLVDELLESWPFDMVVIDESTSFKNASSKRFKALRRIRPYVRRLVLLTGTPSPNGYMDLWAQMYLIDLGQRLGRTLTTYRRTYFKPGRGRGHVVYEWIPLPGSGEAISRKLGEVAISLKAEDYLDVPDLITVDQPVTLSPSELRAYKTFEREQLMTLEGETIMAANAAALSNKLLQYTGGSVYDEEHGYHVVSDAKLDALEDLVEQAGEPVLVYYQYQSEKERICSRLQDVVTFKGEPDILERWNAGGIPVLLAHPASVAYGLNMQQGGRIIVWFTPTWNLELYQQANARLHRQGQTKPCLVYHLIAPQTIDARVTDALTGKSDGQETLLQAIKAMRAELIRS